MSPQVSENQPVGKTTLGLSRIQGLSEEYGGHQANESKNDEYTKQVLVAQGTGIIIEDIAHQRPHEDIGCVANHGDEPNGTARNGKGDFGLLEEGIIKPADTIDAQAGTSDD